ncbi:putative translation initiation factor IF-2 [Streptomyces sp. Tu6071]|nr:putative translation initiation factor IF-2 [Streptomyces sp. Tu6071]
MAATLLGTAAAGLGRVTGTRGRRSGLAALSGRGGRRGELRRGGRRGGRTGRARTGAGSRARGRGLGARGGGLGRGGARGGRLGRRGTRRRGRGGGGRRGCRRPCGRLLARRAGTGTGLAGASALLECVSQFAHHRRLDRRGRRTDEFTEFLELGHDDLALYAELLGELVYPDLSHFAPLRSGGRRTVATSWAYSSRTHRVLIAISTYFRLARYLGRTAVPCGASYGVACST